MNVYKYNIHFLIDGVKSVGYLLLNYPIETLLKELIVSDSSNDERY